MRKLLVLACLLLTSCAMQHTVKKPTKATEPAKTTEPGKASSGSVEAKSQPACMPLAAIASTTTPAVIYPAVADCVKAGHYNEAVPLFAVAGAFGRFDQLRVTDKTAWQAIRMLEVRTFSDLAAGERSAFRQALAQELNTEAPDFKKLCVAVARLGPPTYTPTYMTKRGIQTVNNTGNGKLKSDFNAEKGWQQALRGYLHCP
ncbi:hypothetical protein [Gallaecimonas mangrovi]|uniref:hypothetical protein n=1 Tax=Gallaecimonas mangrovi TaxID=2291597 RepID=UPI000E209101|nr:hypothetical protein [Gallaecimonas mangrovi]